MNRNYSNSNSSSSSTCINGNSGSYNGAFLFSVNNEETGQFGKEMKRSRRFHQNIRYMDECNNEAVAAIQIPAINPIHMRAMYETQLANHRLVQCGSRKANWRNT